MSDSKPHLRVRDVVDVQTAVASRQGRPRVSIIVIAENDALRTFLTLADRASTWRRLGAEFIIVCASRRTATSNMLLNQIDAQVIFGPAGADKSQLRTLALAAATGDVVMLLDNLETADDRWIEQLSASGTAFMAYQTHDGELARM